MGSPIECPQSGYHEIELIVAAKSVESPKKSGLNPNGDFAADHTCAMPGR